MINPCLLKSTSLSHSNGSNYSFTAYYFWHGHMKLTHSAQNTTNTFCKCTIKFLVVQYLTLVENRSIGTVYLKCGKANTLLVEFGGNCKKQNMSVPSTYLLYQVLKILTTLCEPVIAISESIVKTREAHNEKNKRDTMQNVVQNDNLQELYFAVHSLLPKHLCASRTMNTVRQLSCNIMEEVY